MMVKQLKVCLLQLASCMVLLVVAAGCDDHPVQPTIEPEPLQNERLILASDRMYGFANIEYNQDKMPTKFEKDKVGEIVTIAYAPNLCTFETTTNGQIVSRQVYQLVNGVAEKMTNYYLNGNGQLNENYVTLYSYKGGKLDREEIYENGKLSSSFHFFYVGDDISAVEGYDSNGVLLATEKFEYTDLLDRSASLNQWNYMDGHLFPRKSKHLQKEHVVEKKGAVFAHISYTYALDPQGYVTNVEATYNNKSKEVWTNTWQ